jgi:hypothetical protein
MEDEKARFQKSVAWLSEIVGNLGVHVGFARRTRLM